MTVDIFIAADQEQAARDASVTAQLAAEIPGFWAYFLERHPRYRRGDELAPDCLIGRLDVPLIHRDIGETITAYAREYIRQ